MSNARNIASIAGEDVLNASNEIVPVYACRAWVNFDGTGTVAIRDSGNVSSITDNGTGDYTVNYENAMPDENYSVNGNAKVDIGVRTVNLQPSAAHILAGSVRVSAILNSDTGLYDSDFCFVTIFR
jgi:hypothetical protein